MNTENKKGFVLVYAVFLSGIMLTIGVGALGLVLRGFQLTTTSRDSQIAFFAADSAVECVRYWEQHFADYGLANSPFAYEDAIAIPDGVVVCNGSDIKTSPSIVQNLDTQPCNLTLFDESSVQYPFEIVTNAPDARVVGFDLHFENGAYATVLVGQSLALKNDDLDLQIAACGFNSPDPNFARRVERGVDFQY